MYVSMHSLGIHFILRVIMQYNLIYLVQLVPALAIENSFSCLMCFFDMSLSALVLFLFNLFSGTRYARLISYIFCPNSGVSHFFRDLWFHIMEKDIGKQYLSTRCGHCYWGVVSFRPR